MAREIGPVVNPADRDRARMAAVDGRLFGRPHVEGQEKNKGELELRPEDVAANDAPQPDTTMPVPAIDATDLVEVYGWETSWWKKLKSYFGF